MRFLRPIKLGAQGVLSIETLYIFLIVIVGAVLRVFQIQNWLIYSDSHKFILISKAISSFNNVLDVFPQVEWSFSTLWTPYKWLYPVLVGLSESLSGIVFPQDFRNLLNESFFFEHFWVIVPSVLSIYILFRLFRSLKINKSTMLVGILLLAFSGTSIIWSGFIITEPLAVCLTLILILLNTNKSNILYQLVVSILLFLARPELAVIGVVLIVCDIFSKYINTKYIALFQRIVSLLNILTFFYLLIFSYIYRENFQGDFVLYILFLFFTAVFALLKKDIAFDNIVQSELYTKLNLSILSLSYIYLNFNSLISRYVLILIPLLLISTILLINQYTKGKELRNISYLYFVATTLILFHSFYAVAFPKYEIVEYQREVAIKVVKILEDSRVQDPIVYVIQPEGFYIVDTRKYMNIIRIREDNCNDFVSGSFIIVDNAYNEFCEFESSQSFILIEEFKTMSNYRRDNNLAEGSVQIWKKR
jgi:hypothetical protein